MSKQDKYTQSANMQECQVRIPGTCNYTPETTIFAHVGGAGLAYKHYNIIGAYACSDCHDAVDGRAINNDYSYDELQHMMLDGMVRTLTIMINEGTLIL